ncbi:LutC/YkgG family protein [Bailinhaonella thermotolerans]|uniref:Lactate utilization protein C n=1 Tax=Bailinhaonella thermotolerans TaxID=1070861 RepID=A0A3A4A700_9ACTN|nr:LUD domain-containing protein [Bailinhaonella thermotolerans]RJL22797.1 lactate utilization protein C [Bailinhaonella thermotolerans]
MSSRDLILSRIRAAVAGAPETEIPRAYARGGASGADLADLFAERVRDYRAAVRAVPADGVADAVAAALAARGARRLAVPAGLPEEWLAGTEAERVADEPPLTPAALDGLDGVITGCAVAIAATGTIVLDAGPGQGRRALTLVPDYHLCVVTAGQIVDGVPAALERLDPLAPLTWISGPSATSDIELNRVEGVHGPRTLEVVIAL